MNYKQFSIYVYVGLNTYWYIDLKSILRTKKFLYTRHYIRKFHFLSHFTYFPPRHFSKPDHSCITVFPKCFYYHTLILVDDSFA